MKQVLLLIYDCENIVKRTLLSYVDKVERMWIFIDSKSNVETIQVVNDFKENYAGRTEIKTTFVKFTDFSETRNLCLSMSFDKLFTWTIFVDDSYILIGNLDELDELEEEVDLVSIVVKDDKIKYKRPLIFKTKEKFKYTRKIREYLVNTQGNKAQAIRSWKHCWVYDYKDAQSIKRSLERAEFMIEALKGDVHYVSFGYLQVQLYT